MVDVCYPHLYIAGGNTSHTAALLKFVMLSSCQGVRGSDIGKRAQGGAEGAQAGKNLQDQKRDKSVAGKASGVVRKSFFGPTC